MKLPYGMLFIFRQSGSKINVDKRELILCEDCKYWDCENEECHNQTFDIDQGCTHPHMYADDFCSLGEK